VTKGRCATIGLALILGLVGSAQLLGCAAPAPSPAATGAQGDATVHRGDFERELLLTGELRAVRSVEIKAPQTNQFQMRIQFMAEEGTFVEQGDALLDFDNSALAEQERDLESQILDAEIQIGTKRAELASSIKDLEIELAEAEYEFGRSRLEASVDAEVLSRKEYGERQLAHTKATQELEEVHERVALTRERGTAELEVLEISRDKLKKDLLVARQGVELLSIKAPAAGLVVYESRRGTTLRYQEGDSCWPGQGVMRLPDLSEMQVEFAVNEVDSPLLRVGMSVQISLDAFPDRELDGEIVQIPSMAVKRSENSRIAIFKVLADLSETWVGEMKPGMSALGRVVVERRTGVPLIAREKVRFDGERYELIADGADGADGAQGSARPIEPVARNESFYLLSEDDYARLTGATPQTAAVDEGAGGAS
jgi:multidrug efflux pump subunit AcrA (membrane-fusion protein)